MLAFVTGATGFLGSHVARVLAEQGADLRLLVRATSNLKNLEGLKAVSYTHLDVYKRQPFDRLLLAQAQSLGLSILSADAVLDRYDVKRLW